jgi:3-methyladenine DNA glycosylase AlkD
MVGRGITSRGISVAKLRQTARSVLHDLRPSPEEVESAFLQLVGQQDFELQMTSIVLLGYSLGRHPAYDAWRSIECALSCHVGDWANCDALATDVVAPALGVDPSQYPRVQDWGRSLNPWFRRAAIVAAIKAPEGADRTRVLERLIEGLADDRDALVKKAVVWARKSVGGS